MGVKLNCLRSIHFTAGENLLKFEFGQIEIVLHFMRNDCEYIIANYLVFELGELGQSQLAGNCVDRIYDQQRRCSVGEDYRS